MIIDCHGHYTTTPPQLDTFRDQQIAAASGAGRQPATSSLKISDDEIRESIEPAQLKFQQGARHRRDDILAARLRHGPSRRRSLTSPRSGRRSATISSTAPAACFPGISSAPASCRRCRASRRRTASRNSGAASRSWASSPCNLNPDPSGGYWTDPPLTDRHWYPLYEAMVELDVPAMVHVSASCNRVLPRHGRALSECRHDGLHAVPDRRSLQGFSDPEIRHPARRRRGALSLGPLSRAGAKTCAVRRCRNTCCTTCSSTPASITGPASSFCSRSYLSTTFSSPPR